MLSWDAVLKVLHDYGPWGIVLVVAIYVIVNGEIRLHYIYKRRGGKKGDDHK
jgi:hypothetical protein